MNDDGKWVTINGTHVFIKDGQSPMDAFIRQKGKDKKDEPKGFEESKIRDENGELLKVYHGGQNDYDQFDKKFIRERPDGIKGFFFAPESRKESVAGYYAQDIGIIKEAYLNIKNPLYIKTNETEKLENIIKSGEIKKYDGIVSLSDADWSHDYYDYGANQLKQENIKKNDIIEIIAFEPEQIKIINKEKRRK